MKRKNPRLCKVVTVLPFSDREELVSRLQAPLSFVSRRLDSISDSLVKDFKVIQEDIWSSHDWLSSLVEKVLWVSISSLVVSILSLILSFYV